MADGIYRATKASSGVAEKVQDHTTTWGERAAGKVTNGWVVILGDRTYSLRAFSQPGRRFLPHINTFGRFYVGRASKGEYAMTMRHFQFFW